MDTNIKQFLNTFCSQNKYGSPNYTYKSQGGRGNQRLRFKCEVTLEGFNYTGFGSSTNKKDSQTNAARDFVNYLVREKVIAEAAVPKFSQNELVGSSESAMPMENPPIRSMENEDKRFEGYNLSNNTYLTNLFDQKKIEEAEDVDFTADIHGGWTVDNAKSRLHQYIQLSKFNADYKYSAVGPDHQRSFVCELSIFCPQLKKKLNARESASNKQQASKACAVSIVRQMFHLGVIESAGVGVKKAKTDQIPPFKVEVNIGLKENLKQVINDLGLKPPTKPSPDNMDSTNLVTNYAIVDFEPQNHQRPQVIAWSPPLMNWNVWAACNIDEGEEAFLPLQEISSRMKNTFLEKHTRDESLKKAISERQTLPAFSSKDIIIESIFNNQIVLIRGETGSGKTTQVPQYILDSYIENGFGAECNIIVTQPRRISAITLAERVAQERCESLGQSCGYSVRFDTVYPQSYGGILYCTIGSLLRKMESGMRGISHIVVDEIHERDCNTDFLMILLKDMAQSYPMLKIILMSATVDIQLFHNFFPNIFIVEIEGRTHPVNFYFLEDIIEMMDYKPDPTLIKKKKNNKTDDDEEQEETLAGSSITAKLEDIDQDCNQIIDPMYKPQTKMAMSKMSERAIDFDLIEVILKYIDQINLEGAVLIFLPGWNIIQMLLKQLGRHSVFGNTQRYLILPLHSQVAREEQRRVFQPCRSGMRKLILSTNIAESSVTINDVMFVIDSCRAKIKMFTSRNNLTSYNTVWASKTNLEQRRGRAGRVREGFAFHLCSRARFDRLEIHQTPELLRTALHEIALMIKLLRLGDCKHFLGKAIEQPPIDAIIEAEFLLKEMKAFDKNDELTPLGKILARLPIEPRIGKMIIFGSAFGIGYECSIIAASTSLGEPFSLPPDRKRLSRVQVSLACDKNSDHIAILNAFQKWESVKRRGSTAEESFCEAKGLNLSVMQISNEAASQIRSILVDAGFPEESLYPHSIDFFNENSNINVLLSLLVLGLYPNVCYHKEKRKVLTTEGKAALVHKSSVNCSNFVTNFPSPFFIFGEKIRTRAISCKQLSMINPLQLLLFGVRKVTCNETCVILDDWLTLAIDFDLAAHILALRPALEGLLVKVCLNPELVMAPEESDSQLMTIITQLSNPAVCKGIVLENTNFTGQNPMKRSFSYVSNSSVSSQPKYRAMQPNTGTFPGSRPRYPSQSFNNPPSTNYSIRPNATFMTPSLRPHIPRNFNPNTPNNYGRTIPRPRISMNYQAPIESYNYENLQNNTTQPEVDSYYDVTYPPQPSYNCNDVYSDNQMSNNSNNYNSNNYDYPQMPADNGSYEGRVDQNTYDLQQNYSIPDTGAFMRPRGNFQRGFSSNRGFNNGNNARW